MKRLLLSALVLASSSLFANDAWQTNYKAALEQSAKESRPVLINFTGSDWCGWCIKMQKDTFSQQAFKDFAEKNLILLELDFPKGKPQSADLQAQNDELQKKYGVRGFPTLVLLNSKGKEVARNPGYLAGGPSALIEWVKEAAK